eukprot:scaffold2013_cov63-Phaeocystis_antarctica.AAC.2
MIGWRASNDEVRRDPTRRTSLVGFSAVSLATHCCNASLDVTALYSFLSTSSKPTTTHRLHRERKSAATKKLHLRLVVPLSPLVESLALSSFHLTIIAEPRGYAEPAEVHLRSKHCPTLPRWLELED